MTDYQITKDPQLTVRDLVNSSWDNTNTSIGEDPFIHTGLWNESHQIHQVSITGRDEESLGDTGFTAFGINGPKNRLSGVITATVWVQYDPDALGVQPKVLRSEMSEELFRIIPAEFAGMDAVDYFGMEGPSNAKDEDYEPFILGFHHTVMYTLLREP